MLVLTRKLMDKLYIGDDICITVVRLEGGQVRLGIDAPRDVAVIRGELVTPRPETRASASVASAGPHRPKLNYSSSEPRGNGNRRRGRFR
jgi:carbon storage regulator